MAAGGYTGASASFKELMPMELMVKTPCRTWRCDIRGIWQLGYRCAASNSNAIQLLMNDGLISRNLMEIVGLETSANYTTRGAGDFGDDEVRG